jgi:hypothetical protein
MVSWWPGEGNANDIRDENDGTLQGGASFDTGKVGQAFNFDGSNDYVNVPDSNTLDGMSELTVDAWLKREQFGTLQMIVVKGQLNGDDTSSYGLWFDPANNDRVSWAVDTTTGLNTVVSSQSIIDNTTFHHIVGTYKDGEIALYIDGVLGQSAPLSGTVRDTSDPLTFGKRSHPTAPDYFGGLIDEVEIFNRALSESEIQAIFYADSAGKCHYSLNLFEDGDPSDLVYNLGQEARAVAETVDPVVTQVEFRWIDPGANIETEIVPLTLGSAESTFTPDEVGMWTVEADFGNGVVVRQTLDIDFMVIPESAIGAIALVGSSLAALGVFALRKRHGNNQPHSIGDSGI